MMTTGAATAVSPHGNPVPAANPSSGDAGSQSAGITANDFLTLLVTEMKNQDPTAQTDPNAYINQLVQVNSLQQLIEINENLSSALGGAKAHSTPDRAQAAPRSEAHGEHSTTPPATSAAVHPDGGSSGTVPVTFGNLSIPSPTPAAQRVANALYGSR